jgi:hypothetical protein
VFFAGFKQDSPRFFRGPSWLSPTKRMNVKLVYFILAFIVTDKQRKGDEKPGSRIHSHSEKEQGERKDAG